MTAVACSRVVVMAGVSIMGASLMNGWRAGSGRTGGREQLVERGETRFHPGRRRRLEYRIAHRLRRVAQRHDERRAAVGLGELDGADGIALVPLLVVALGADQALARHHFTVLSADGELGALGAAPHPAIASSLAHVHLAHGPRPARHLAEPPL